mmetsp:Transcript_3269/g.8156  ORF Transcript_3269/g.8156 Transcript_3269/m.8156 type:complete len:327 (+) Transcript_3269:60-1040(+)
MGCGLSRLCRVDPCKLLPVAYLSSLIACIYSIHRYYHVQRLHGAVANLVLEGRVCMIITALLVICMLRCVFTAPGYVPNTHEYQFIYSYDKTNERSKPIEDEHGLTFNEVKRTGATRHCKWCQKYKPDRSHHCRVCQTCVLRMDHHCPWLYNCIGQNNHKYFYLLLLYSTIDLLYVSWTMIPSVRAVLLPEADFMTLFITLFGETVSLLMGTTCLCFWSFHSWLIAHNLTTIEYCEKSSAGKSLHSQGSMLANVQALLGSSVLLWFLPLSSSDCESWFRARAETTPLLSEPANGDFGSLRKKEADQEMGVESDCMEVLPLKVAQEV